MDHDIIQSHDGNLSPPGKAFYLFLSRFHRLLCSSTLSLKTLVREDEQGMRESMVRSLQKEKYVVKAAADFYAAREKLEVYHYDCILLDICLPGGS